MNKQFNRQRRHNNNRTSRPVAMQQITRFTNFDSSGPMGKLRGTPLQLVEKYQAGAKDAQMQGDDVLFQTCQQYADHYLRLQAIAIENEQAKTKVEPVVSVESTLEENKDVSTQEKETPETKKAEVPVGEKAKAPQVLQVPKAPVVEKRPIIRHKKAPENSLSMPIDALQEKSEITE